MEIFYTCNYESPEIWKTNGSDRLSANWRSRKESHRVACIAVFRTLCSSSVFLEESWRAVDLGSTLGPRVER